VVTTDTSPGTQDGKETASCTTAWSTSESSRARLSGGGSPQPPRPRRPRGHAPAAAHVLDRLTARPSVPRAAPSLPPHKGPDHRLPLLSTLLGPQARDPLRLLHRLAQASVCAGVKATRARDDDRAPRLAPCPLPHRPDKASVCATAARALAARPLRASAEPQRRQPHPRPIARRLPGGCMVGNALVSAEAKRSSRL